MAAAPTDPQNADKLGNAIVEMMKEFADKGPSGRRARDGEEADHSNAEAGMKEPAFWLGQLAELRYRGRALSDLKLLPDIYKTFTVQQVQDASKKYTTDASVLKIEVIPETAPATSPASPKQAMGTDK